MDMIKYILPENWIRYDKSKIVDQLIGAKAALISLTSIPYQKRWADELQILQLKREIAGTSKIEGADFTEGEFEDAFKESFEQLHTRSQKQAAATVKAYRWIAQIENEKPITEELVFHIHRLIIKDADDDHCPPGVIRGKDQNVLFGIPRHRGCEGGPICSEAFSSLCRAINKEISEHDPLIQALATHYHFAAMHPFLDGNGRTARALEALMLQRVGLKDSLFIAMSNYYYEEKNEYLKSLADVRANNHDLTSFLLFGLKGIELQCRRLFEEIRKNISKVLFKNVMYDLFKRLQTKRRRVIAERQVEILKILLENGQTLDELNKKVSLIYKELENPHKAFIRDINHLISLGAIGFTKEKNDIYNIFVKLEWAKEITESEFFEKIKEMPKAKTHGFL
ncbi:Fic family protein [bacterium]|nr:Fic family protein [bacterium]